MAHIELDDIDAESRQRMNLDCVVHLLDQGHEVALAASGGDERGERILAQRGADLGVHHVGQLEFRAGAVAHRLEEALGIGDAPQREAAHHHVLLVG